MTNFFKREPFVTLGGGTCRYHPERDAMYRVFIPRLDPIPACGECKERILQEYEDENPVAAS